MKIRIISWNVNGIRAVERKKELQNLIQKYEPDIFFLQEIKANQDQLSKYLTENENYNQHYHSAEKKGYSGTGLWIAKKNNLKNYSIFTGMEDWNDFEGRVIELVLKDFHFFGIYFPNGGKSHEAWLGKLDFYYHFLQIINKKRKKGKKIIFMGDFNVAHNEIDLARPKENEKNIGFLPEEREWVDTLIKNGWKDAFRFFYPEEVNYTWWNMQTRARERNVGWRIDYFFTDEQLLNQITRVEHLENHMGSDHCPIMLEMDLNII